MLLGDLRQLPLLVHGVLGEGQEVLIQVTRRSAASPGPSAGEVEVRGWGWDGPCVDPVPAAAAPGRKTRVGVEGWG